MPWLRRWLVIASVAVLATAVAACQECDSCCPECPQAASVTPVPCPPTAMPPVVGPGPDRRPAPDISGYVCHDADGDNLCTAADGTSESPPAAASGAVVQVTLTGTEADGGLVASTSIAPRAVDGYFEFFGLESGTYSLEVTGVDAGLSPVWERDGSNDGTVSGIVLSGTAGARAEPPFERDLDFVYQ